MENKKALTDAQILQEVLNAIGHNANSLNTELGYSSVSSVPHILKGRNSLSRGMKERIINKFPNVSMSFLNKGTYPVLLSGPALKMQANIYNIPLNSNDSKKSLLDLNRLASLPEQLDRIESMLSEILQNKKGSTE